MTKMTGGLRQRMLDSLEKSMAQVFAGGLKVVAEHRLRNIPRTAHCRQQRIHQ